MNSKGQVTIPADIRKKAGLAPHTEVEVGFDGCAVQVRPATAKRGDGHGARVVRHLPGRGDIAVSADGIMALTWGDKWMPSAAQRTRAGVGRYVTRP
jgi:AbrB family looped-hinge helix DNA binding protein